MTAAEEADTKATRAAKLYQAESAANRNSWAHREALDATSRATPTHSTALCVAGSSVPRDWMRASISRVRGSGADRAARAGGGGGGGAGAPGAPTPSRRRPAGPAAAAAAAAALAPDCPPLAPPAAAAAAARWRRRAWSVDMKRAGRARGWWAAPDGREACWGCGSAGPAPARAIEELGGTSPDTPSSGAADTARGRREEDRTAGGGAAAGGVRSGSGPHRSPSSDEEGGEDGPPPSPMRCLTGEGEGYNVPGGGAAGPSGGSARVGLRGEGG